MQVGGAFDRFEYCISGAPMEQISIAEPIAKSGQTCASPEYLKEFLEMIARAGGSIKMESPLVDTNTEGFKLISPITD